MHKSFHKENRECLYQTLAPNSMVVLFSGQALRKTGDEDYPFFADRSFVYYTGIEQADSVLTAVHDHTTTEETLFMLPPDAHAERWNGKRLTPEEAEEHSAVFAESDEGGNEPRERGRQTISDITKILFSISRLRFLRESRPFILILTEEKKMNSLFVWHTDLLHGCKNSFHL